MNKELLRRRLAPIFVAGATLFSGCRLKLGNANIEIARRPGGLNPKDLVVEVTSAGGAIFHAEAETGSGGSAIHVYNRDKSGNSTFQTDFQTP